MPAADEDATALAVDELALDYLLWHAIRALLREREARLVAPTSAAHAAATQIANSAMRLAQAFHQRFLQQHPRAALPEPLALRVRIARLVALALRRVDVAPPPTALAGPTPEERARRWLARQPEPAAPALPPALFADTPFVPAPAPAPAQPTLRHVLWEFLVLSSHAAGVFEEVSDLWMEMAVQLMQQALLEAYLDLGAAGPAAAAECFAVGLAAADADAGVDEIVVNDMFAADGGCVGAAFARLRREALADFEPPAGWRRGWRALLEDVRARAPWAAFEEQFLGSYVAAVIAALGKPVLAQLEEGRLDGFKDEDVRDMLLDAGVDGAPWAH